jgi:hypothetical protein
MWNPTWAGFDAGAAGSAFFFVYENRTCLLTY